MDPRVIVLFIACAVSAFGGVRFQSYKTERVRTQLVTLERDMARKVAEAKVNQQKQRVDYDAAMEKKDAKFQEVIAATGLRESALRKRLQQATASNRRVPTTPEATSSSDAEAPVIGLTEQAGNDPISLAKDCESDANSLILAQDYINQTQVLYGTPAHE